jgi:tRNA 2-thiouridine synthesizing protein A
MTEGEVPAADDVWDTGDLECGELLLPLRRRIQALPPGGILCLITRSPSARLDLLAWSRMTGHRVVKAIPPNFFIQRKEPEHGP